MGKFSGFDGRVGEMTSQSKVVHSRSFQYVHISCALWDALFPGDRSGQVPQREGELSSGRGSSGAQTQSGFQTGKLRLESCFLSMF